MLDKCNPLVKIFLHARDLLEKHNGIDISIHILGAEKGDPIQYELPHTEDLAMLIVGDLNLEKYKRDIVVSTKNKGLQRITIFHPAYMALQYPLLFPYGERGFQLGIPYHENESNKKKEILLQCMNIINITCTIDQINQIHFYAMVDSPNKP